MIMTRDVRQIMWRFVCMILLVIVVVLISLLVLGVSWVVAGRIVLLVPFFVLVPGFIIVEGISWFGDELEHGIVALFISLMLTYTGVYIAERITAFMTFMHLFWVVIIIHVTAVVFVIIRLLVLRMIKHKSGKRELV